jgi:hypothetical protein
MYFVVSYFSSLEAIFHLFSKRYEITLGKSAFVAQMSHFGKPKQKWEDDIKTNLRSSECRFELDSYCSVECLIAGFCELYDEHSGS